MAEIECPTFSELVACEMDGDYKIAQGWTQSTGQGGRFPYTLHEGWIFDTRYSDIEDPSLGTHGGCPDCIMTLVHLISIDHVVVDLCEGVVCDDVCIGNDLWSQKCVDGSCVQDAIIESNSPTCSYIPPGEEEWYDVFVDNAGYLLLFVAAGFAINEMAK